MGLRRYANNGINTALMSIVAVLTVLRRDWLSTGRTVNVLFAINIICAPAPPTHPRSHLLGTTRHTWEDVSYAIGSGLATAVMICMWMMAH